MKKLIVLLALFAVANLPIYAVERDPVLWQFYDPVVYELTAAEREMVEQVVACEAGADSAEGQRMIAQCIMDYSVDNGLTIAETMAALQISTYQRAVTDENREAVAAVFDLGERVTSEHAYWWYQPGLCNSAWHETQRFIIQVESGHKFFGRW